jgi:hypothetical protein
MPRLCSFSRLPLIALLLAVLGSVAWAKPKVAILGLEAANSGVVDPKDAANAAKLTEELRAIPRGGIGKYDFAPNSNRELQDEKLMGNCDTEKPTCMAPIGNGLGADYLIFGNISKASDHGKDGYKAKLQILNVKSKNVEETSETFVPLTLFNGGNGAKEWAQKVYAKLTGEKPPPTVPDHPESGPGKLVIKGNVPSGDVYIGAAKKGRLEGGTITLTLPEGPADVVIDAPGHKRYEATVTIAAGQTKSIDAVLEEVVGPPPPLPGGKSAGFPVLKATGFGLVGVGAVAGAYALYLQVLGPAADYSGNGNDGKFPYRPLQSDPTLPDKSMQYPAASKDCNTAEGKALRAVNDPYNEAFDAACSASKRQTIAVVVGIASGVLGLGTLYFAYRSDGKSAEQHSSVGKRTRRQLTVTPVVSASGGGATVRFDW